MEHKNLLRPMSDNMGFIKCYIPATQKALVFLVRNVCNLTEVINYGALPLESGKTFSLYGGGTVTSGAAGVMPANSYTSSGVRFPTTDSVYDKTDMFYMSENYARRLFDVVLETTPKWLRVGLEIPVGSNQYRFQDDKVPLGVPKSFGWSRGAIETLMLPEIHQGFVFGNDTNVAVNTGARIRYSELEVEMPRDPTTILKVLRGEYKAKTITLPISIIDRSVDSALTKVYGYTGFDMGTIWDTETALASINKILPGVKI